MPLLHHDNAHAHGSGLAPRISSYSFIEDLRLTSPHRVFESANPSAAAGFWPSTDAFVSHRFEPAFPRDFQTGRKDGNRGLDFDASLRLLSFRALNKTFEIVIKEKEDLIVPKGLSIEIDGKPASHALTSSLYGRTYEGTVIADESGWARVTFNSDSTHSGRWSLDPSQDLAFEGMLSLGGNIYHVQTIENYKKASRFRMDTAVASPFSRPHSAQASSMILYADSDEDLLRLSERTCTSGHERQTLCGTDLRNRRRASSETSSSGSLCGFDANNPHNARAAARIDRSDMQDRNGLRRRDIACGTTKQYMFMGAAADCRYVANYGGTEGALRKILSNFNQASATFESSFNVGLALIKVHLESTCWNGTDPLKTWNQPCSTNYSIGQRLSDFSLWRGRKQDSQTDNAGLWHLMSGCASETAVGIAWLQTTCLTSVSNPSSANGGGNYVSGTAVSSIVPTEWKVVAHEIGHNFGAIHDCTAETCETSNGSSSCCACSPSCDCQGRYLMHPTDNAVSSNFSACSIHDICQSLTSTDRNSCLKPPGALTAITENICGNGVREGSEQCDCGDSDTCASDPCCDGTTCRLKSGAVCSDKNDDCCSNCQPKPRTAICRASLGPCDPAETCDGVNSTCPVDTRLPDQQSCGDGLVCLSGQCTSRGVQCVDNTGTRGYNTTTICPSDPGCLKICLATNGQCVQLPGTFVDGTPCGNSGQCRNGRCSEPVSASSLILPIAIVAGVALCFVLLGLVCCIRRPRVHTSAAQLPVIGTAGPAAVPATVMRSPYAEIYAVQQPTIERMAPFMTSDQSNWVDASKYNGPNYS
ncbi:Metallo-peptidase family M12-domain-containing protein [Zopfochytrium polystomum]|nr:Metallo-peptidase family M12-domain-containing protein [Zopfochytrium polystomum]